ncbi:MAG: DUF2934 domain-containing protein [bacterium]|nr:DUF2934 domain-containing protein [bacterium]
MAKRVNKRGGSTSKTQKSVPDTRSELREEQIRQRAYELYLARGACLGDPMGDWLRAEQELRSSATERQTTGAAS